MNCLPDVVLSNLLLIVSGCICIRGIHRKLIWIGTLLHCAKFCRFRPASLFYVADEGC